MYHPCFDNVPCPLRTGACKESEDFALTCVVRNEEMLDLVNAIGIDMFKRVDIVMIP